MCSYNIGAFCFLRVYLLPYFLIKIPF
uniref:Uncharacterized protein n=1 Tax=Arundo donax TaxID=35708 RepID=A0A0A8XWN7_ARUDO